MSAASPRLSPTEKPLTALDLPSLRSLRPPFLLEQLLVPFKRHLSALQHNLQLASFAFLVLLFLLFGPGRLLHALLEIREVLGVVVVHGCWGVIGDVGDTFCYLSMNSGYVCYLVGDETCMPTVMLGEG